MPTILISTEIDAPIKRVFDLSCSIDFHQASAGKTKERAVAGITSGLIGLNETVTWEATHFFLRQRLSVKITKFDRPMYFVDEMISGAFKRFTHEHSYGQEDLKTIMVDRFDFDSPFGFIGEIADALFLKQYMRLFITERNEVIKQVAESEEWRKFLKTN